MSQPSSQPTSQPTEPRIPWDERYHADHYLFGTEPNRYLQSQAWRLRPGMCALSVADGEGRNGVWLAEQGLDVLSVDQSAVGLAKAAQLAAQRGVPLRTEVADLRTWSWPEGAFDLIPSIFFHVHVADRTAIHAQMARALRPGGLIVLESYHPRQLERSTGGPRDRAMLLTAEDAQREFATLEIVELLEGVALIDEGTLHTGLAEVVRMVARKPLG
jgi:SAM-dependent methyltransferase